MTDIILIEVAVALSFSSNHEADIFPGSCKMQEEAMPLMICPKMRKSKYSDHNQCKSSALVVQNQSISTSDLKVNPIRTGDFWFLKDSGVRKLSETPGTVPIVSKLCMIDSKYRKLPKN